MFAVKIILLLGLTYLLAGVVFALIFLAKGIEKVDTSARGSGIGFRLIIFPGTVALWPVLLNKWMNAKQVKP